MKVALPLKVLPLLLLALLLSVPRPACAQVALGNLDSNVCYNMKLVEVSDAKGSDPEPEAGYIAANLGWTSSLFRRGSRDEFVFVDAAFGRLARVPVGAPLRASIDKLAKAGEKGFYEVKHPAYGAATPDGGFVARIDRLGPDQLIFVNRELQLERTFDLPVELDGGESLEFISKFAPLQNRGLLAVGFFQSGGSFDGYLTHISEDLKGVRKIGEALDDQVELLYTRDFSPVTTIGDTGYALVMAKEPWIARVEIGSGEIKRLPGFPERFQEVPREVLSAEWDELVPAGLERMFRLYELVEGSQMPAGIFAWNRRLFILAKEAVVESFSGEGRTGWFLVEVDPATGEQIVEFRLPSHARHLALSPGEVFAVLEKGRINKVSCKDGPQENASCNRSEPVLFRNTETLKLFSAEMLSPNGRLANDPEEDVQCVDLAVVK